MDNGKRKVASLCLLLVISGGWMALAARQGGEPDGQTSDDKKGPSTRDFALETANPPASARSRPSSFLNDPNLASSSGLRLGQGELFWKMMLSVGLVIGLGAATLYLSQRVLPRGARAAGREIRILETAGLGPRKALHLVEVGGQRLLVASTNESVTMLTCLNEAAWPGVPNAPFCVGEPLDLSKPQAGEAVKI